MNLQGFGALAVTTSRKFTGFGSINVTKAYQMLHNSVFLVLGTGFEPALARNLAHTHQKRAEIARPGPFGTRFW